MDTVTHHVRESRAATEFLSFNGKRRARYTHAHTSASWLNPGGLFGILGKQSLSVTALLAAGPASKKP